MNIETPGSPDGMKLDQNGNIYCTGPGGVCVLDDKGRHLGTIVTPETPANCAWGDDGRSLYITAQTSVYRIRTLDKGLMNPPQKIGR
ncbi:MAG: SMP-30/gluconolactonase/LRE family protein [Desulfobacterales bacterium]|nr:MAG: SMP-30/gluconolactonase/LRE family protein [Desulfobacterales bacterium]